MSELTRQSEIYSRMVKQYGRKYMNHVDLHKWADQLKLAEEVFLIWSVREEQLRSLQQSVTNGLL